MRKRETLQNPYFLKRLFRRRVSNIIVAIIILFILLFSRLFYLQVLQHRYYTTLSNTNSINFIPLAPVRGNIYDRNGVILAENKPVFSLTIIPDRTKNLSETVKALSKIVTISPDDIDSFYKEAQQKHAFVPIPLVVNLSAKDVARFSVNKYRFPGVSIKASLIRHYPFANDMASVLGYVGRINQNDLNTVDSSNYAATNYIGKVGIEKYFETQLHGDIGYQQIEANASGREIRVLKRTPPVHGTNLYLSIDSGLQEAALQAMKDDRGALVAIQPSTGQVLAMVSTPAYNPNLFVSGISAKAYHNLQVSKDQPLFNRAIRGQFSFGSTIKVFFALEGLEGNYVTPDFEIFEPGYFKIGGHTFHSEVKNMWVNLVKSIEVSSDTYFYRLSLKMGIDSMDNILQQFGFGQYTNIEMNEELPGLIASPAWKLKTKGRRWYSGDTVNSSIGQGSMLTTPLQLASGTATLAMRGQHFQPTLINRIQTPDGKITTDTPTPLAPITIKQKNWDTVIQGMVNVIRGSQGTGWRFGKPSYSVAAKTGTAQVYSLRGEKYILANVPARLRDNSMFIAFAPVDHPIIAIAVAVQNNPYAPKVAREVLDYYLLKQKMLFPNPVTSQSTALEPSHASQ